jgi:hypothetical protein
VRRARLVFGLAALFVSGCHTLPVERLGLTRIAAGAKPDAEAVQRGSLRQDKTYFTRLIPVYGPLFGTWWPIRVRGGDGARYNGSELAEAWEDLDLKPQALEMGVAHRFSRTLSPILDLSGLGCMAYGIGDYYGYRGSSIGLFYTGLGLLAASWVAELGADVLADRALAAHNRWLAERAGLEEPASDGAAVLRSLVLPGWGQFYKGDPVDAALFLAANVGLLVGGLDTGDHNETGGLLWAFGAAYTLNLLDAWALPPALKVQSAMALLPEPGGLRLAHLTRF